MNKKISLFIIILIIILFLIGCSKKEPVVEDISEQKKSEKIIEQPNEDESFKEKSPSQQESTNIYINGNELDPFKLLELESLYGPIEAGEYWYDSLSGLQGKLGEQAAGAIFPGHDLGSLSADASNGDTGIFINGRELPESEVQYLESLLGVERIPGDYDLDGYGNLAFSGEFPFANLYSALQEETGTTWSSSTTGAGGGSQGGCSYVNIPGSTGVSAGFVSTGC